MAKTLEQLKEENAKLEAEAAANPQEAVEDEPEAQDEGLEAETDDQAAELPAEEGESDADQDKPDEEGKEVEPEDWMKPDDDQTSSGSDRKFTDSDIAAAKNKLKAKLQRKHDEETEKLKARLKELEQGKQPDLQKPKREQFLDHDDPDEAFAEAVAEWKWNQKNAESQAEKAAQDAERKRIERMQEVSQGVDEHYQRAVTLAEESGISAEMYQSADYRVRQAVDDVFEGAGDTIADALISNLGKGSERVFYNLGVNKTRLSELQSLLRTDPSGIKAAVFLGELKHDLTAPKKRQSNAPRPAPQADGDAAVTQSAKALKSKYDKAHAKGDSQTAFNAKREAKQAGVDTSKW
jgi:hypothetical protein